MKIVNWQARWIADLLRDEIRYTHESLGARLDAPFDVEQLPQLVLRSTRFVDILKPINIQFEYAVILQPSATSLTITVQPSATSFTIVVQPLANPLTITEGPSAGNN